MSLKQLSTEEMVQVSGLWVGEGPAREALLTCPELASLVPRVEVAHRALVEAQPQGPDPRLADVVREATAADTEHDVTVRGISALLDGLVLLCADAARRERLIGLREVLLPSGVGVTRLSYRAEAGAGALLVARLGAHPEVWAELDAIDVLGRPLRAHVDAWIAVAERLGTLEDRRAALTPDQPSGAQRHLAARNGWIRTVNALLANAALAELGEPARGRVFGSLERATEVASRRARPAPQAGPVEPEPSSAPA